MERIISAIRQFFARLFRKDSGNGGTPKSSV